MKTEMLSQKHDVLGIALHIIYRRKWRQVQTGMSLKMLHNMNKLNAYHIQGIHSDYSL